MLAPIHAAKHTKQSKNKKVQVVYNKSLQLNILHQTRQIIAITSNTAKNTRHA